MHLKKMFSPYAGLNRGIYILFAARIINCIGNFVFPFLTLFLTSSMGMSSDKAGFFIMLTSLAGIPGTLIGGMLADHRGRKAVFVMAMMMSALCMFPCAFLGKSMIIPWLVIASSFFGAMVHPASSAMVADLTISEKRSSAYALLYLGINIGTAIGPLIAGFLFNNHLKLLFIGEASTTAAAALLILFCIKETIPLKEDLDKVGSIINENEKAENGNTFILLLKRPFLLSFALVTAVMTFVYSQHSFILPMFTEKIFSNDGPGIYGTLMSVNCIVVVLMTTLLTTLTKRFKPTLNTVFAALTYIVGFGMLYFSSQYSLFLLSTFIWTVGEILATTNFQVYIAAHSPVTHRGRFNAVISFISRSGNTIGPGVMGMYINKNGLEAAWPVIALLAAFSALCMLILYLVEGMSKKRRLKSVELSDIDF